MVKGVCRTKIKIKEFTEILAHNRVYFAKHVLKSALATLSRAGRQYFSQKIIPIFIFNARNEDLIDCCCKIKQVPFNSHHILTGLNKVT